MKLLTRQNLADRFQVTLSTIDKWTKKGVLKPLRAGDQYRTVRFNENDVKKIFKQHKN